MLRQNWPLIVYTILTQSAVGLCIFLAAHLWLYTGESADSVFAMSRAGLVAACIFVALGTIVSGMHLGKPLRAYRAVANIKSSWLSREITATGVLFVLVAVSSLAGPGLSGVERALFRWLVTATALFGSLTIMIMAYAYSKAGKAAWAGYGPHALFLSSTLVLGAAASALVAVAVDAVTVPTSGMLGPALCLSFGVLAAALSRTEDGYHDTLTVTGSALSLLGMIMMYSAALSAGKPERGVLLPMFAAAAILSGELIARYGFMSRGLVEKPGHRASFGMLFKALLSYPAFTMTSLRPGSGAAEWKHCEGEPNVKLSSGARPVEVQETERAQVTESETPKELPDAAAIKGERQSAHSTSGVTISDAELSALLEDISIEDFFTRLLPDKSADMLAMLKGIDLSFMEGKDFRCQFDIDSQVFSVNLKGGKELDFIKGPIERAHIVLKVAEKDWRDAITGKFNSAARYYTGDITSLLDAKRYKAVITLKGGLNLSLKMDDGRVLGLQAIFGGTPSPAVDLSLAMKDYLAVLSKTVSTQALIITNKVKFKGNMMLLLKFQNLL